VVTVPPGLTSSCIGLVSRVGLSARTSFFKAISRNYTDKGVIELGCPGASWRDDSSRGGQSRVVRKISLCSRDTMADHLLISRSEQGTIRVCNKL
jgi:hypothetical protein